MTSAGTGWDFIQKHIIVGDAGCGKTSLLVRLTDGSFHSESEPTIGVDFGSKIISSQQGHRIKLQLWDTSGQEAFRSITKSYYRGAEGCLLVFDVTYRQSFTDCRAWMNDIREFAADDVVVMLVANKLDLTSGEHATERAVTEEEAIAFANEHGLEYAETSAKSGRGVEEAFSAVARAIHMRIQASRAARRRDASGRSFPLNDAITSPTVNKCC